MSTKNSLAAKQARRAEREIRKGAFVPTQVSFARTNKVTKIYFDDEGNQIDEEVDEPSGEFFHAPARKDRRRQR